MPHAKSDRTGINKMTKHEQKRHKQWSTSSKTNDQINCKQIDTLYS
jgi:hypothetical protein